MSKCPFSGTPEGEAVPQIDYQELWKQCIVCQISHQGTCPCAKCGELAHVAIDCMVSGMEEWSKVPTS